MTGSMLLSLALLGTGQADKTPPKVPERKPATYWVEELKKRDPIVRQSAARILGEYRDQAKEAVPALIVALKDDQPPVREQAALSLTKLWPAAEPAVPALMEGIRDKTNTRNFRSYAITALDRIGKADAVPALIEVLQIDPFLQYHVLTVLGNFGEEARIAVPWIIELLQTPNSAVASIALRRIGPVAIPELREARKDDRDMVRLHAAAVLSILDRNEAEEAIRILTAALSDADPKVRQVASWLLFAMEPNPALVAVLRDLLLRTPQHKMAAALALGRMGPAAASAAEPILYMLASEKRGRHPLVQDSLVQIGPEIIPVLRRVLEYDWPLIRLEAAWCLYRIDPQAPEAIAVMLDIIKGKDQELATRAIGYLGEIGPPQAPAAIAVMIDIIKGEDRQLAARAIGYLGEIGPRAEPAVPALIEALECNGCRQSALRTLAKIGPGAKAAVPALIEGLRKIYDHDLIILALAGIGPEARPAIPQLSEMFNQLNLGDVAALALSRIGPEALPVLLEKLQYPTADVRKRALLAIGRMGPAARDAVPAVTKALKDKSTTLHALYAVKDLGPAAQPSVPAILELLEEKDQPHFVPVLEALRGIGPPAAKDAVPVLIRQLSSQRPRAGEMAAWALTFLGPEGAAALGKALKDPNPEVRENAAKGLMYDNPTAWAAVPVLCAVVKDPNEKREVFQPAFNALVRLCTDADPPRPEVHDALRVALPTLVALVKSENAMHREGAVYTLGKIGPRAREAIAPLKELLKEQLKDTDLLSRLRTAETLWAIEGQSASVLPTLLPILKEGYDSHQVRAAEILARMGPPAREAVPTLLFVLRRNAEEKVKVAIGSALKSIDPRTAYLQGIP